MAEMHFDGLNFQMVVVGEKIVGVDGFELDVVMDEEEETASPTITRTIAADDGIVRKRRIGVTRTQLCFLNAGDSDVVFGEIRGQFIFGRLDAIDVEVEDARRINERTKRTRRTIGTLIWRNPGDEKENEDQCSRKF